MVINAAAPSGRYHKGTSAGIISIFRKNRKEENGVNSGWGDVGRGGSMVD